MSDLGQLCFVCARYTSRDSFERTRVFLTYFYCLDLQTIQLCNGIFSKFFGIWYFWQLLNSIKEYVLSLKCLFLV